MKQKYNLGDMVHRALEGWWNKKMSKQYSDNTFAARNFQQDLQQEIFQFYYFFELWNKFENMYWH